MIQAAQFQNAFFKYKSYFLIALLVIFYSVGLFGLTSSYRDQFLPLSFMNLAISFIILLIGRHQHSLKFYIFIIASFIIGMSAEWIGVHTGLLFGDYHYGESLGFHIFGVPFIIGINWGMLSIISATLAAYLKVNKWIKIILGALFMTLLDMLIEPVAILSDYWVWDGPIPFSNFVTWFLIALFLQFLYFNLKLAEKNKVAFTLYIIQVIFFTILNLAL